MRQSPFLFLLFLSSLETRNSQLIELLTCSLQLASCSSLLSKLATRNSYLLTCCLPPSSPVRVIRPNSCNSIITTCQRTSNTGFLNPQHSLAHQQITGKMPQAIPVTTPDTVCHAEDLSVNLTLVSVVSLQ
jgi:hypothetical protein